jgi:hypothetical protein
MVGRLDNEYRLRSSEAPLLTRMPGDYIRDFFYTSQPLDPLEDPEHNRMLFELFSGETQLLYSSDYPHQDFELPGAVADLGFLSEEARRAILGGNAARLFGLADVKLQDRHPELFAT